MNQDRTRTYYQVGGSLAHQSCYVERIADRQLESALRDGEFCYVLNSRQMGKSSLRVRTMDKLQREGTICIAIDLTGMGTQEMTPEKWYAGIVRSLVSTCRLKFNWRSWWREKRDLFSPAPRLNLFIEEVLLVEVKSQIVVFIDEIDRVLSQDFSLDDFFALIHSCYQKRQQNPAYNRLTFALFGVASARDLIRDKTQSPFTIGRAIPLEGFKLAEASPLLSGMAEKVTNPQQTLAEILYWTGGQPFLTQKLCQLVVTSSESESIASLVAEYIVKDWEVQDEPEHLKTIRDRLCYRSTKTIRWLGLYRNILQRQQIPSDRSSAQMELRLSGLVRETQGKLQVSNRIYATVFNLAWIDEQLAQLRPYDRALANWIASDCHDTDRLLKGQELQDTLTWALGKSLADIDYRFLVASQEFAKQKAENALIAVEAASRLLATARKQAQQQAKRQKLAKPWQAAIAFGVTGLILLLRYTGLWQSWEWNLLDRFFRWRLVDRQEARITVVMIDESDIKQVGQWPIPDRTLARAIKNIQVHQPSAIALDIYRDLPVPPGNPELLELFNESNIYAVEKVIGDRIPPPPNVDPEQVGFADQVLDSDGKIRRALLTLVTEDKTRFSLGTKLALSYLQEREIELEPLDRDRYGLGKATFKPFSSNDGGYVRADEGGYQALLNYWGKEANFPHYPLRSVLKGEIAPEHIRDRLIFIGSTAESIRDTFYTPYSKGWFRSPQKMPGVFIQANIASQIINAAIDNRPLLRTSNKALESLWILAWGIVAAVLSQRLRSLISTILVIIAAGILLIIICYLAFLSGWWLPLIPALLTLTATAIAIIIIRNKQRDRQKFQYTLDSILQESDPLVRKIALEYFKLSEDLSYITINSNKLDRGAGGDRPTLNPIK